ncbi:MAG: single-stranded DNA-binding protein [Verrucomicrobia bacterium]|jgi:single stranded DNA-binding protein|nr:single-stranded DNA-binding protein [Verrucomicrobiota bacterium]
MFQTNKIQLTGNITKAPETRQAGDSTVTSARLMHNMEFPKGDGEFVERIAAIDLEIWGKRGEAFARHINTKTPVYVDGYLLLDQWEHEGKPHSRLLIRVNDWQFLTAPADDAKTKDSQPKGEAKKADKPSRATAAA